MPVAISPYTLHRNPAHFPDPERCDPDRWTPEHEAKLLRYAYLPFGAGPHSCPGNHFALMEAQLVLATLVQPVTFDLVPGQQIEPAKMLVLVLDTLHAEHAVVLRNHLRGILLAL